VERLRTGVVSKQGRVKCNALQIPSDVVGSMQHSVDVSTRRNRGSCGVGRVNRRRCCWMQSKKNVLTGTLLKRLQRTPAGWTLNEGIRVLPEGFVLFSASSSNLAAEPDAPIPCDPRHPPISEGVGECLCRNMGTALPTDPAVINNVGVANAGYAYSRIPYTGRPWLRGYAYRRRQITRKVLQAFYK
jgi:hypothetical protein